MKHSELYIICIDIDIFMGNVRWERCMRNMARNYPMILLYHVFDPIWKKWTVVGDMWIKRWVDGLRPCKSEGEEGWHGIVLLVGTFGSAWKFRVIHGNVR